MAIILYYLPNSSTALKPGYRERLLQIPDRILRNPDLHNYVVLGGTSLEWIKAGIKRFISVNLFSKPFELFWIKMPNCTPYLNLLKELVERPEGERQLVPKIDQELGQAHDMFSRIFRIRIYELFLPNIIQYLF